MEVNLPYGRNEAGPVSCGEYHMDKNLYVFGMRRNLFPAVMFREIGGGAGNIQHTGLLVKKCRMIKNTTLRAYHGR